MRYDVLPEGPHAKQIEGFFAGRLRSNAKPPPLTTFTVVGFTNRSGSNLLCSALSRLGLAGPPTYEHLNSDRVERVSLEYGISTFEDYIFHCMEQRSRTGNFTIKLSVQQLNFIMETGILGNLETRPNFIWVRRRNTLAQAISLLTALQTGRWTSYQHLCEASPLAFDEGQILALARSIGEQNAWFELFFDYHGITPQVFWYEDFCENQEELCNEIAASYGLDGTRFPSAVQVERQVAGHKAEWEDQLRRAGQRGGVVSDNHIVSSAQPIGP